MTQDEYDRASAFAAHYELPWHAEGLSAEREAWAACWAAARKPCLHQIAEPAAAPQAAVPKIDWEAAATEIAVEVANNCGTVPNLTHPYIYLGLKKLFTTAHPAEGVPALDLESLAMPKNPYSAADDPKQHVAWAQGAGAVFATVEAALAATPAAPAAPAADALDAARYRWLRDFHAGDEGIQDELPYIAAGTDNEAAWALAGADADEFIDAARAAQGGA
ncbi:MAG: hypothetical protein LBV14_12135 [Acidovorax sp.]|jgi:hypothetical protein|nr:hypothetical protein [Acidovorax sp.]